MLLFSSIAWSVTDRYAGSQARIFGAFFDRPHRANIFKSWPRELVSFFSARG
jgi:hypothetical protein